MEEEEEEEEGGLCPAFVPFLSECLVRWVSREVVGSAVLCCACVCVLGV